MQTRGLRGPVDLLNWLHFFNHAQEGGKNMKEHYKNPMIHKALDALQALSADEKTRELAERREKALKDEAMFLNEAKKIGRMEGKREIIIKLLKKNLLPIEQIADLTGLDKQEIEKLRLSISEPGELS